MFRPWRIIATSLLATGALFLAACGGTTAPPDPAKTTASIMSVEQCQRSGNLVVTIDLVGGEQHTEAQLYRHNDPDRFENTDLISATWGGEDGTVYWTIKDNNPRVVVCDVLVAAHRGEEGVRPQFQFDRNRAVVMMETTQALKGQKVTYIYIRGHFQDVQPCVDC